MSSVTREEATAAELPTTAASGISPGKRHELLRPALVENAVLIADLVLILAASFICSLAYQWIATGDVANATSLVGVGIIVAVNFAAIMTARQNYRLKNLTLFYTQARDTIVIWSGVSGLLAVAGFTMKISSDFSRGSTALFFAGGLATLLGWRLLVANFISKSLARGTFAQKKIIIIAERDQNDSSLSLAELQRCGYFPVKTYEISREEIVSPGLTGSLRSKLADVIRLARKENIEDIYLVVRWHHHRTIDAILNALAALAISVHLVPDESAARFLTHPVVNIGSTWTAVLRRAPLTKVELAAKRFFDLSLALAALVTLLPLILITAALIKLDSRGPIFFLQQRNGFNGKTFYIYKFRTMHVWEDGPDIKQATRNDPRVTRLGRWLRRSSIDELPQFLNVIRGEMSIVGPRPHALSHDFEYEKLVANYAFRHHVKPGLTGWAQVNGYRGETSRVEQMERRVEHDLWYINNWSLLLDSRIILKTLIVTLGHPSAY